MKSEYKLTQPNAFSIFNRAIETTVATLDRIQLANYLVIARNNGIPLDIISIGDDFNLTSNGIFDQNYTISLFRYGHDRAPSRFDSALECAGKNFSDNRAKPIAKCGREHRQ